MQVFDYPQEGSMSEWASAVSVISALLAAALWGISALVNLPVIGSAWGAIANLDPFYAALKRVARLNGAAAAFAFVYPATIDAHSLNTDVCAGPRSHCKCEPLVRISPEMRPSSNVCSSFNGARMDGWHLVRLRRVVFSAREWRTAASDFGLSRHILLGEVNCPSSAVGSH